MKLLLVIDMQKDFIDGALGTAEAVEIVDDVVYEMNEWDGPILLTRDTHQEDYLTTQEGRRLPVVHCVEGTEGWALNTKIQEVVDAKGLAVLNKPTFGSLELPDFIRANVENADELEEIELIGLCTDICVISNASICKAAFPETDVKVKASCCAGVSPETHQNALDAMSVCQIDII